MILTVFFLLEVQSHLFESDKPLIGSISSSFLYVRSSHYFGVTAMVQVASSNRLVDTGKD